MQVIGLCRFSYLARGGFQVMHADDAERAAYLYAPERMEERFRSFEALCLPSIKAQTDPDFTLMIATSDRMPKPYFDRLRDLTAGMPQVVIEHFPPRKHRPIMQKAINLVRRFDDAPCLQFRHDDDDAVAVDFVERIRREAHSLTAFSAAHPYVAIDFNRGFSVSLSPEGIYAKEEFRPYLGCGLAVQVAPREEMTVMNFGHHKVNMKMPTVTFTDEDMWLRGLGGYNDSRQKPGLAAPDLKILDEDEEYYFKVRYGVDSDDVRRLHSGLS